MGTHPIFESDFDCLTDFSYGTSNLFIMVFEKFVSIGGVVFSEAHQKPMAVVNVISLNRLLCDDGNCGRYEVTVKKAWAAANMTEAYAGTDMAKAAATKQRRANL